MTKKKRLLIATTKGFIYSFATVGILAILLMLTADFNIIVGLIVCLIGIASLYYDFDHYKG